MAMNMITLLSAVSALWMLLVVAPSAWLLKRDHLTFFPAREGDQPLNTVK